MIPLRSFLIVREHDRLPFPEGTACAEVLKASQSGGSQAKNVFLGLAVGAGLKALTSWLQVIPDTISFKLPLLKKAIIGVDLSGALLGVGYILGPRIASIMVGGGLLSALVIIPGIAWWGGRGFTRGRYRRDCFCAWSAPCVVRNGLGGFSARSSDHRGGGSGHLDCVVRPAGAVKLSLSIQTGLEWSYEVSA